MFGTQLMFKRGGNYEKNYYAGCGDFYIDNDCGCFIRVWRQIRK